MDKSNTNSSEKSVTAGTLGNDMFNENAENEPSSGQTEVMEGIIEEKHLSGNGSKDGVAGQNNDAELGQSETFSNCMLLPSRIRADADNTNAIAASCEEAKFLENTNEVKHLFGDRSLDTAAAPYFNTEPLAESRRCGLQSNKKLLLNRTRGNSTQKGASDEQAEFLENTNQVKPLFGDRSLATAAAPNYNTQPFVEPRRCGLQSNVELLFNRTRANAGNKTQIAASYDQAEFLENTNEVKHLFGDRCLDAAAAPNYNTQPFEQLLRRELRSDPSNTMLLLNQTTADVVNNTETGASYDHAKFLERARKWKHCGDRYKHTAAGPKSDTQLAVSNSLTKSEGPTQENSACATNQMNASDATLPQTEELTAPNDSVPATDENRPSIIYGPNLTSRIMQDLLPLPCVDAYSKAATVKRLQKEALEMSTNPPPGCSAGPEDDNLYKWSATVTGPVGTPYEDGLFQLQFMFPRSYPLKPPLVKFITPIYHCNVDRLGNICLDILQRQWSPALLVSSILLSILCLLQDCNPKDPLDAAIGKQCLENRALYDKTARQWTRKHAQDAD